MNFPRGLRPGLPTCRCISSMLCDLSEEEQEQSWEQEVNEGSEDDEDGDQGWRARQYDFMCLMITNFRFLISVRFSSSYSILPSTPPFSVSSSYLRLLSTLPSPTLSHSSPSLPYFSLRVFVSSPLLSLPLPTLLSPPHARTCAISVSPASW
eukprot:743245-Hanusia_phi.AAC.1